MVRDFFPMGWTAVLLCLLLSACVSTPPARPFAQQGRFEQFALNDHVFRLRYTGFVHTRAAQAEERLLVYAAQTTLQHGYSHFEVVNASTDAATNRQAVRFWLGTGSWGGAPLGWGMAPYWSRPYGGLRGGPWGWMDDGWPDLYPPKPLQDSLTIACHHGDQGGKTLFNAHTVLASLGPRHGVNPDGSEQPIDRATPQRPPK